MVALLQGGLSGLETLFRYHWGTDRGIIIYVFDVMSDVNGNFEVDR